VPGLVALGVDPGVLAGLVAEIGRGAVLVTGSNGKGTTCRMLARVMVAGGLHPVVNAEGSNQRSGLAAMVVARAGLGGHLPADGQAIGVFEVDEGSLGQIVGQVRWPRALVVTNIFGDQLDRYLEPAYVRVLVEQAMAALPADTVLVLNADDPQVACLGPALENRRVYFGVQDAGAGRATSGRVPGSPRCPRCDGELSYSCVFYAHLGHWACGSCGLARPQPHVSAARVELAGMSGSRVQVVTPAAGPGAAAGTVGTVMEVPLPGLYNACNALAAAAAASVCELPVWSLSAVGQVSAGSIRMEKVAIAGRQVVLALAKNAGGYTEVLRAVLGDQQQRPVLLGLNDCPGKQPDTSWIWDVDFGPLAGLVPAPVVCGNRAADLAVRLKYAGWAGSGPGPGGVVVEPDPVRALRAALAAAPPGQPLWVISTAVVLLRLRRWLAQQGCAPQDWREQDLSEDGAAR
jgi:lipid II isoglutaminyl synthase (glutamine-hydrolysing)